MAEEQPRSLNCFSGFTFEHDFWQASKVDRQSFSQSWLSGLQEAARQVEVYQVFPAQADCDILVWTAVPLEDECSTSAFFEAFARATLPHRRYLSPAVSLWGYTGRSTYSKARSAQEIDPFSHERSRYLVMYPFVKTEAWYLLSRHARQGMMNEHIRLGKQYPQIKQLLLYSFGVQDQEFVVVYETDDLPLFSQLVQELRGTDARPYTKRDAPLYTAVHHPAEETLGLWTAA